MMSERDNDNDDHFHDVPPLATPACRSVSSLRGRGRFARQVGAARLCLKSFLRQQQRGDVVIKDR